MKKGEVSKGTKMTFEVIHNNFGLFIVLWSQGCYMQGSNIFPPLLREAHGCWMHMIDNLNGMQLAQNLCSMCK